MQTHTPTPAQGGDSVNFYFAPENTPKSTPEPESTAKNGPYQYCQDHPDSVNIFSALKYKFCFAICTNLLEAYDQIVIVLGAIQLQSDPKVTSGVRRDSIQSE